MGVEGHGVVYLRQEGVVSGWEKEIESLQFARSRRRHGAGQLDLAAADGRSFLLATAILKDLGLFDIRLLTNNRQDFGGGGQDETRAWWNLKSS